MKRATPQPLKNFWHWFLEPVPFLVTLCALIPIAAVIAYMDSYTLSVPSFDQWLWSAPVAVKTAEGTLTPADLVEPFNGHRPLFSRLVTALATVTTGWNIRIEVYANLLIALASLGMLLNLLRRDEPGGVVIALVPFSALVMLLSQRVVWSNALLSAFLFVTFFLLIAVTALRVGSGRWWGLFVALAAATCATFSNSHGVVVWVALALTLFLFGYRQLTHYVVWVASAAVVIGLFLWGNGFALGGGGADDHLNLFLYDPVTLTRYVTAFIGSPIYFDRGNPASVVGATGLVLFAVNLWHLRQRDGSTLATWVTLVLFVGGTGTITALGRLDFGLGNALTGWYRSIGLLFWVALAALMTMTVRGLWRRESRAGYGAVLLRVNLLATALIAGLVLYGSYQSVQGESLFHGDKLHPGRPPLEPYPDEVCIRAYPFSRDFSCLRRGGQREGDLIDLLAAHRLTIFAHEPRMSVLPATYSAGSPVLIESDSLWLNNHIQDWLLAGLPADDVLHLAPEPTRDHAASIPGAPLRVVHLPQADPDRGIGQFVGDARQVWAVTTPSADHADSWLRERAYVQVAALALPVGDLTLRRYYHLPAAEQVAYTFGERIQLDGWRVRDSVTRSACDSLAVESVWQVRESITRNFSLTLVLAGADGGGVANADGAPADTLMQLWQTDQPYLDERSITLPCDLPPGEYPLLFGVYDYESGEQLPISAGDGSPAGNLLYLTTVFVE